MSLTLYTNPMSRGRIARWALEETGAAYEVRVLQYGAEMKAPGYLALNPMGKVPALEHDGMVITETAAILAYLADAFPDANLAPPPAGPWRGPYYRWLFFCAGPLEAAITDKSLNAEVTPEKSMFVGYGCMEQTLDVLEQAVSAAPYLAGDGFTMADLYLAAHLGFGLRFGSIAPRPAFADYMARMMSRPAALRADALDDAAMPAPS